MRSIPPAAPPRTRRLWRFWRADPAADADAEVRFHLESQIAEFVEGGMTPADARTAALRRFGDVSDISRSLHQLGKQRERAVRLAERFDRVGQDLRFAARQFAHHPLFTAAAMLTMAIGIGANTAIFSVTDSVLLKPLPYANGNRLLDLRERNGSGSMVVTFGNYGVWRQEATDFEALGAYYYDSFTLTGAGESQRIAAYRVTADYWRALSIPPVAGRYFTAQEDRPGAPHVVVLSHAIWKSAFGGDRGIVGHPITLDGEPYTVVGVASPEYALNTFAPAIWVPLAITSAELQQHSDHELTVVGLVRPGISTADAVAQLTRIETRLAGQYPNSYFDGGIVATPLQSSVVAPARPLIWMLTGAVGLVLLIACVNVANLLLARGATRRKEVAIRGALGAGRRRIVGQLLVESLVLAVGGGAIGMLMAIPLLQFLVRWAPASVPRMHEATLDLPVLLFTLALSLVCGLVFGLVPALRVSKLDLQQALREGTRGSGASVRDRVRAGLVVAEIALALILLNGAGLLLRSAVDLQRVNPGFDTHNLLLAGLQLPQAAYASDTAAAVTLERIAANVAVVPGVKSAALVSRPPIASGGADCAFWPEGSQGPSNAYGANGRVATPNFFETMGIPLVRGRAFGPADLSGAPPVAMINASLARELYGPADPIGRRIAACADPATGKAQWATIVGVTGDIRASGLGAGIRDEVYYPLAQKPQRAMALVVRGSLPVAALTQAIRRVVVAVDPQLPLSQPMTMEEVVRRSMASSRFTMTLFALLGLTGLVLATVGVYGVIAYFVVQRTHEFGVRMALGADASRVVSQVVRHGLTLGLIGVGIGSVVSLWATQLVHGELYDVSPHDPATFAAVAAILVLVTALASFIPARRATRVDPVICLRDG